MYTQSAHNIALNSILAASQTQYENRWVERQRELEYWLEVNVFGTEGKDLYCSCGALGCKTCVVSTRGGYY